MTKREIERLVSDWQKRLKLEHWSIKVDWSRSPREDAYATTHRRIKYDIAEIYFDSEYRTWSKDFAEQLVVHELLHLTTRDLDQVIGDLEDLLRLESFKLVEKRYDHEIEGVVDRFATIVVELLR